MNVITTQVDFTLFSPDYTVYGSAEDLEDQFAGLKFSGPGWYENGTDTLLVLPVRTPHEDPSYRVHAWNCVGPRQVMSAVMSLPLREAGGK